MKSIIRDPETPPITLNQFYQKIEKEEFEHHIKLITEDKDSKHEVFQILTVLGKGRAGFAFLSLVDRKLVALRMSYEKEDLTGKFESVKEKMGENYKRFFLDILYPSIPIQHLYSGVLRKKKTVSFDKTVFVSFWEKADALLENKLNEGFEKKFKWFREFLEGLSIIHSKDRAHFDIKPDNLFLVDNQLKIGDFEFYWKIEDFIKAKEYLYCGTIGYIAPELFYDRENITTRIDIFSTGVAFARLFTGETYQKTELTPEENRQLKELLKKCEKISHFTQAHLAEIKQSLSYSLFYRRLVKERIEKHDLSAFETFIYQEILLKMMDLDPACRPDVQEIIDQIVTKEPTKKELAEIALPGEDQAMAVEPPEPTKSPKWLWLTVGLLVVLTISSFLYFFVFNKAKPSRPPGRDETKSIKTAVKEGPKTPGKEKTQKPTQKKVKPDKTIEPPKTTKPDLSPEKKEELTKLGEYKAYLYMANELMNDGEYKGALDMVARAGQIKQGNDLLVLEKKIRQLMAKEEQTNYETFYAKARVCYEQGLYKKGLENVESARNIKDTPQLAALELRIKNKIREKEEEYKKGLALVEEYRFYENYTKAKEVIEALKKIKVDEFLLRLEKEVDRKLMQKLQEEEAGYREFLIRANVYMDNGDLEKAEEELEKARQIKINEEFVQLEERLNGLTEKVQGDYKDYYQWARYYFDYGNLDEARRYIELAKEIKQTGELRELERQIQEKARKIEEEQAAIKADDEAYFKAILSEKVWDLDEYIREYPHGRHIEEAKDKLNKMLEHVIPRVEEPRVIERVEPIYPRSARRKRISGIVWLEAAIDIHGNVTRVAVTEGHRMLRYAAKKAVKQWKYEPVMIGGKPRAVSFTVKVEVGPSEGNGH